MSAESIISSNLFLRKMIPLESTRLYDAPYARKELRNQRASVHRAAGRNVPVYTRWLLQTQQYRGNPWECYRHIALDDLVVALHRELVPGDLLLSSGP